MAYIKLQPKDAFHLTDEEIDLLQIHSGTYPHDADEAIKQKWREAYRKVEAESNRMIALHGSIEKWYKSGEGRLL